ncbi:MAG: hypothetical protein AAB846_02355, partial [Patescibacteria group bacterium]
VKKPLIQKRRIKISRIAGDYRRDQYNRLAAIAHRMLPKYLESILGLSFHLIYSYENQSYHILTE